jgi:hypothetical protein
MRRGSIDLDKSDEMTSVMCGGPSWLPIKVHIFRYLCASTHFHVKVYYNTHMILNRHHSARGCHSFPQAHLQTTHNGIQAPSTSHLPTPATPSIPCIPRNYLSPRITTRDHTIQPHTPRLRSFRGSMVIAGYDRVPQGHSQDLHHPISLLRPLRSQARPALGSLETLVAFQVRHRSRQARR